MWRIFDGACIAGDKAKLGWCGRGTGVLPAAEPSETGAVPGTEDLGQRSRVVFLCGNLRAYCVIDLAQLIRNFLRFLHVALCIAMCVRMGHLDV